MIRLYTLGTTHLAADSGRSFARLLTQPKLLALLSYLTVASPRAFQRRDTLLALFWPEYDAQHARWALNQAIRRLRSELEPSVMTSRGADAIAVSPDILWCDAVALQDSCAREDWSAAVQLYRGAFLDGLHIAGCVELAQWMDSQRAVLRQLAAQATWSLVDRLEAQGALREAIERARNGVSLTPEREPGVRRLIALLDACGDRAGAVQVYEEYVNWLRENFELEPAPETVAAIHAVKSRAAATPAVSSSLPAESAEQVATPSPDRHVGRGAQYPRNGLSSVGIPAAVLRTVLLLSMTALWIRGDDGSSDMPKSVAAASSTIRPIPSITSIAVLPLNNQLRDPQQDYFVEGMHEALITELSKISALKVISRTSTMRYRETRKPLSQVARELNVEGVIEGSVVRDGDRVRITVRLIDGTTENQLWSQTFDRELRSLLALQSEVARSIAEEIRVTLTPQEQRLLASFPSVDPAAHQAYLKGRYYLGKGTLAAFQTGHDFFRQAIDQDPTYAPAYVGLADAYNRLAIEGRAAPREVYPLARAALVRALEIEETSAEAHALRGVVRFRFEWDWEGAEQDLKRALELEPNSARAHLAYSTYSLAAGHLEEAIAHSAEFRELDPLSPFANENLAWVLYHSGQYDEAISRLRIALDLDPRSGVAYSQLGINYAAKKMNGEAATACNTALDLAGDDDEVLSTCGAVYAVSGERQHAVVLFDNLQRRLSQRYVDPYYLASLAAAIYTAPTEKHRVLPWLARAYEQRSANLCMVQADPAFRRLSADPQFRELLRKMDFPK
jgi:TolB-like protein/DNA-binding SARP family transcriptional activator/Flp pilus assembly protein TadD